MYFVYLFKNQLLVSLIFAVFFFVSISFVSAWIFMTSFLLLTLGFVLFSLVVLGIRLGCLRFLLFPEVRLYCYKLSSQNFCGPQVLDHHVFILICLQVIFDFLFDLFSDLYCLASMCLCFFFQLFSSQLISNLIAFWLEYMGISTYTHIHSYKVILILYKKAEAPIL